LEGRPVKQYDTLNASRTPSKSALALTLMDEAILPANQCGASHYFLSAG
jgi:hypothetical protein